MWQFVTVAAEAEGNGAHSVPVKASRPRRLGEISHTLTHRQYLFEVFICDARDGKELEEASRCWTTLDGLQAFPLPRPHLKIVEMLREQIIPK